MPQIVRVRRKVRADSSRAIATRIVDSRADIDLIARVQGRGGRSIREPVLYIRVVVAKVMAGEARHGVVNVCHAVLVSGLGRDEFGKGGVAYAGGAEGVELTGSTVVCSPTIRKKLISCDTR